MIQVVVASKGVKKHQRRADVAKDDDVEKLTLRCHRPMLRVSLEPGYG